MFLGSTAESHAAGIPFVDLPKPYEKSGPVVSIPARVAGGTLGTAVGVLIVPPAIIVSILPLVGLLDAIIVPPTWGWAIGEHTLGRVIGLPILLVKAVVWDLPLAIIGVGGDD